MNTQNFFETVASAARDLEEIKAQYDCQYDAFVHNQRYAERVQTGSNSSFENQLINVLDKKNLILQNRYKECEYVLSQGWTVLELVAQNHSIEYEQVLEARYIFNASYTQIAAERKYKSHNSARKKVQDALTWVSQNVKQDYLNFDKAGKYDR